MSKMRAAREGSSEIYFAVIATSITLAVVFIPVIFLQGFVGRLFREFGVVVAGAVLISAFVSLTLTPVLNVYASRKSTEPGWFYRVTEPFLEDLKMDMVDCLPIFKIQMDSNCRIGYLSWRELLFFNAIPSELAPMEDRGQFRLLVSAPEGTSYDRMDKYVDKLSQLMMDSVPEHEVVLSVTSPGFTGSGAANTGFVRVILTEPSQRKSSQDQIVQRVSKSLSKIGEGRAFPIQEQTISVSRRSGLPVQFVIQNSNFEKLKSVLPTFLEEAAKSPKLINVDSDLKFNKPELKIEVDRLKASDLGVSVEDVAQTLQLALSNRRFGYFTMNGRQYQVIGQVSRNFRDAPSDLKTFYVRTKDGNSISLDNLVNISEGINTPTIYHFNRYKSATISAGLAPGFTLGEGIEEMKNCR